MMDIINKIDETLGKVNEGKKIASFGSMTKADKSIGGISITLDTTETGEKYITFVPQTGSGGASILLTQIDKFIDIVNKAKKKR